MSDQDIPPKKPESVPRGTVFTFYSFKGGVGRSMALANVAVLLARAGQRVLIVDWDLEAPGLHRFFTVDNRSLDTSAKTRPGMIDLVLAQKDGTTIDWHDCVYDHKIRGAKESVAILTAGDLAADYNEKLQKLNWDYLFEKRDLGVYLEELRTSWINEYDSILVDSRTGVSDVGGICTVLLPDVLIVLFTTTWQSVKGTISTVNWARERRALLPVDRSRLLVIPVPARDESQAEYKRTLQWREIYAREFADIYSDWIPKLMKPSDMVNKLYVPYVAIWSFGEALPVVEEESESPDPRSITAAYKTLARLLKARLNWLEIETEASLELELTKQTLAAERKRWRRSMFLLVIGLLIVFGVGIFFLLSHLQTVKSREADTRSRAAVEESQSLVTKLLSETDPTAADQLLEQFKELAGETSVAYLAQEERVADLLMRSKVYVRAGNHFAHLYLTTKDPAARARFAVATADMYLAGGLAKNAVPYYEFAVDYTGKQLSGDLALHFVRSKLLAEDGTKRGKTILKGCFEKIGDAALTAALVEITSYSSLYPVSKTSLVDAFTYLAEQYEVNHEDPGSNFWARYASAADAVGDKETAEKVRKKAAPPDQSKP